MEFAFGKFIKKTVAGFENRNKPNTGKSTMHHVHFFNSIVYSDEMILIIYAKLKSSSGELWVGFYASNYADIFH